MVLKTPAAQPQPPRTQVIEVVLCARRSNDRFNHFFIPTRSQFRGMQRKATRNNTLNSSQQLAAAGRQHMHCEFAPLLSGSPQPWRLASLFMCSIIVVAAR